MKQLYSGAFVFLSCLCFSSIGHGQSVTADGTTATTVTTDAGGKSTVAIAPANSSGISHNKYVNFSVPTAGVDLDNRIETARTILNEVTSGNISILNGALSVLGQPAHVIVANPNGIKVDGGSFVNTGGVVLSTGRVSFKSIPLAPGLFQDNIVLTTDSGRIDIGTKGLSGAMTSLQLLSSQIKVDGEIKNTSSNTRSDVQLIAGGSEVEYDSSILATSNLEDWGTLTKQGVAGGGVAIEITERGSVKANRITMISTNEGAAVKHAGTSLASIGNFTLDAKGKITTRSANIRAAVNVKISGTEHDLASEAGKAQSKIEAVSGALTLLAETGGIANTGVLLSGAARDASDSDSTGGVTMKAAGDISFLSERADQLAIVFASNDDLIVETDGKLTNDTGRFLSNAKTSITANGDVENKIRLNLSEGGIVKVRQTSSRGKRLWYTLWQARETYESYYANYGSLDIPNQLAFIVGNSVDIKTEGNFSNLGGEVNANNGNLNIDTKVLKNERFLAGEIRYEKRCRWVCWGYGTSTVDVFGGTLNASQDININADGSFFNKGGSLTSFGNVNIFSPEITMTGLFRPAIIERPKGLYNLWRGKTPFLGFYDDGGNITASRGDIQLQAFSPVMVHGGSIEAGGSIIAPNGVDIVSKPRAFIDLRDYPIGIFHEWVGE